MKKTYEFNIEDINTVMIIASDTLKNTQIYTRENPNSRLFVERYDAEVEDKGDNVGIICPRCNRWNYISKEYYNNDEFEFNCEYCHGEIENTCDENDLIDIIMSLLDDDFRDINLFINNIHIV